MARVTKINVGGTNYDIAHEGELKNSGFEVVTALPTTGLFAGREVMYNGKKYVYSSGWKEEITANTMYEANLLWGGRNIPKGFSPVDAAMMSELSSNVIAFPNPEGISIEYSRDGGVTWLDYEATDARKVNLFTSKGYCVCGNSTTTALGMLVRITITPAICGFYTSLNKLILHSYNFGSAKSWCTLKGLSSVNVNAGNEDDSFYSTIFEKERIDGSPAYSVLNFSQIYTAPEVNNHNNWFYRLRLVFGFDEVSNANTKPLVITQLRFFGIYRFTLPSNLAKYNHLYSYDWQQNALFPAKVESKEVINFDINNIEPTQVGSVTKTSTWLWQYLVQGVNWLKANNVRLSAYNTKVAALEQADSDNNASIQSVSTDLTELSNGLAAVARSGSYNDLIDKPTFSGSYNDLTDKPTLFSGSYDDLTDKPTLATVATSGSYNDLTDTPTLAAVATSGDYNDLLNRPTFSGSYNDLTDTPTLAAVATSGSYNDLTNTPTQLPNPNALNITVLDSEGALLGPSMVYDGVAAKYFKLIEGYGIRLSNSNLSNSNSHNVTINLKQIAGTTLLGNANSTTDIPQAITMAQLRTMLGSLTLNGISVTLGGNSSYTLPCFISYSGTLYQARIENNWLQIYRNGVWANLYYLLSSLPTECRYITDLSDPSWYDDSVSEYELDNSATTQLLLANSSTNIANWIEAINANQITFNSSVIASKDYNKGALDNIISNLKSNGYSVFVENDIDTILSSGNDWVISIKIKRFNDTSKAIIECYVAK